jgi:catechol 2,3-dioxygenase-like lactoylglutathione lyase family enzyme
LSAKRFLGAARGDAAVAKASEPWRERDILGRSATGTCDGDQRGSRARLTPPSERLRKYRPGADVACNSNAAHGATNEGSSTMFENNDAVANLAVKNLDQAKKFYEGTLGLKPVHAEGEELIVYKTGNSTFNVYRSQYAGTNKATAMTWMVGDQLDSIVRDLKGKGIKFEHYDMPGMKLEGDVHVGDHMKVAWFKDPDGNILNVISGET